ncbi:MAG: sugar porter family MFS transporter [Verrucomicrobia bacterium]|nr:sugar porter family MFS transporter [Verrucomicrobiota bacterium]
MPVAATPPSQPSATVRVNLSYLIPICLVATLGGLIFGYDTGIISGAIEPLTAKFALSDIMKGWVSGCVLIGCAFGVLVVGPLSDRFGRKLAMFLAALMFLISAIGTAVPNDIWVFIAFRFLAGLGIGIASISTPMYIAEITPASVRGRLIAVNQIAIVGGLAIVYFANYGIAMCGPHYAGVPAPSQALEKTLAIEFSPAEINAQQGTFTLACGTVEGIQTGIGCSLGLLADAKKSKPSRVALATIDSVSEHQCKATLIPAALPNIDWAALKPNQTGYPKLVATFLSPAESWNIHTGWRWMFLSGAFPSVIFALLLLFIPESPRWLIEQNRDEKGRSILAKVAGAEFAAIESAAIRDSLVGEQSSWSELFSPKLKVPLALGIALAILQQVTGINVFMYFGTTIFNNLSSKTGVDAGMLAQAIIGGSGVLFTIVAIATVDKWGRKPLMFIGTAGMMLSLVAMGVMAQTLPDPTTASNAMLAFIILYIACFGLSVGPVVWVILAEIFPTAVRGRALGLATCCLWLADYVVTQTFPMMDQNAWLIAKFSHAFPFYVYAGFCVVLLGVMCLVPETKGRTLEEIERSWATMKNPPDRR